MFASSTEPIRVLHVDDDPDFAELASTFLEREADVLSVVTETSARDALDRLASEDLDCIVSDYEMPGMNGLELFDAVKEEDPDLPVILFTGKGSEEIASEAISAGVTDYIQKESGTDQYTVLAKRIEEAVSKNRAERRVRDQQERYRRLVDHSPVPIVVYRAGGEILYVNDAAVDLFDAEEPDDLRGEQTTYLTHPEDREWASQRARHVVEDREPVPSTELRIRTLTGDTKHAIVATAPVTFGGDPAGHAVLKDITERKERERELERYERLVENLPVGVYRNTPGEAGEFVDVNDAMVRIFDAESKEELLDTNVSEFYQDDTRRAETSRKLADEGVIRNEELKQTTLEGNEIWISVTAVKTEEDGRTYYDGIVEDITELRERTRELEETKERFEKVFEHSNDAIFISDIEDDEILDCNAAAAALVGTSQAELRSMAPSDLHPHNLSEVKDWVETVFKRGHGRTDDITCRRVDGERVPVEISAGVAEFDGRPCLVNNVRDISDRKSYERRLERYETIIETLGDPVYALDDEDRLTYVNDAFESLTGYSEDALLGEEITTVVEGADALTGNSLAWQLIAAESSHTTFEAAITTPDGDRIPCEINAGLLSLDDGGSGIAGVIRDISERKERERALQEERDRVRALFDNMLDAAAYFEFEGDEPVSRDVNPAFEETFGYDAETAIGQSIDDIVVPEDKRQQATEINRRVKSGGRLENQVRRRTVDGLRDFILRSIPLVPGESGEKSYAIYSDVTERKEREQELERYETIVEAAGDPVYTLDSDARFTFVNTAFEDLAGYSADELLGEHVSVVMDEDDIEQGTELIRGLLSNDGRVNETYEMDIITAEGDRIACENHIALLPFDDEFRGTTGVVRDITERKERERTLERQNDRLDEFASVVSHDLRNPLNVANGSLELVRADCESEELDVVAGSLDRMESLVDDLLTLARKGATVSDTEPIRLATVLHDAWGAVETPGADLVIDTDLAIEADPSRFQQLLENLLRNAVEHGGSDVTITVGPLGDGSGFYVEDDGTGIPAEVHEDVFDSGYTTTDEGTGFGLSIARQIADAHGWEIRATEGTEGGARFEITGVEYAPTPEP